MRGTTAERIERSGADRLPLYARVEKELRAAIRRDYRPGDLLPTQQELARGTGTSLITVKRALDELARSGLVEAIRGRGTVVKRPVVSDDHEGVSSFTESMAGLGLEARTAWTKLYERVPPKTLKAILGMKARAKTVCVERLRTVDGEPFCLLENELPAVLVPGLAARGFVTESIYQALDEDYGLRPVRAEEEVTARAATREERDLLGSDTRIVMEVCRISYLDNGRPMERAILRAPAHLYRYRVGIRDQRTEGRKGRWTEGNI